MTSVARKSASKTDRAPAPPGPLGTSPVAFLRAFRRDRMRLFLDAQRRFGDIVRFRVGPKWLYLVLDPEAVQRVLQENHRNYDKRSAGYGKLKLALGDGLLTSEGEFWRRQRRIVQPAFHRDRLHQFGAVMTQATLAMLERWREPAQQREPVDVAAEMMRLTLEIIGTTMFSTNLGSDSRRLGELMTTAIEYINERITTWTAAFDFPEKLPTVKNRRFRQALRAGNQMVREVIEARRRSGTDHGDLLSMLMQMRDEETGEWMTDQQLRDEIITIFAAGHETTANALAWCWYLLSRNPAVGRKLREELDRVLGGRVPTADDLPRLTYTAMVVKETMRLYPPAWVISRNAVGDDVLGGFHIAAGSVVLVSPYVTHRHLRFWENPEGFDPERFVGDRLAALPRYVYFPFGGGPRMCIGTGFAMMEAQLILATVAQRHELHLLPGESVEPEPLVTLRPRHGVMALVQARS